MQLTSFSPSVDIRSELCIEVEAELRFTSASSLSYVFRVSQHTLFRSSGSIVSASSLKAPIAADMCCRKERWICQSKAGLSAFVPLLAITERLT